MRVLLRQTQAVTTLELMRVARARATPVALVGFVALLALGQWLHLRALHPRPDDDRLFGYAFLAALMIGLRFGFSTDRKHGTEQLMLGNLIQPAALYLGKVVALTATLLIFTGIALLSAAIISTGDWNFALWYALVMMLAIWLFTPLILLMELGMETRYPGLAAFASFVVLVAIATFTIGAPKLTQLLGFELQRFNYATLQPLAWRTLLAALALGFLYPLWRWRAGPL